VVLGWSTTAITRKRIRILIAIIPGASQRAATISTSAFALVAKNLGSFQLPLALGRVLTHDV